MGIFFFNWCGYRLVTDYLAQQADTPFETVSALSLHNESGSSPKTQLLNAREAFFQLVKDLGNTTAPHNSGGGHSLKNPVTDYWQHQQQWNIHEPLYTHSPFITGAIHLPVDPVLLSRGQPPRC
jgi:hypothetical protein